MRKSRRRKLLVILILGALSLGFKIVLPGLHARLTSKNPSKSMPIFTVKGPQLERGTRKESRPRYLPQIVIPFAPKDFKSRRVSESNIKSIIDDSPSADPICLFFMQDPIARAINVLDRLAADDIHSQAFVALSTENLERYSSLASKSESTELKAVGLIVRLGLLSKKSQDIVFDNDELSRAINQIEAFKQFDAENAFWPLAELVFRNGRGLSVDADALLREAAGRKKFTDPVHSFYSSQFRRASLDPLSFFATRKLYTDAPITDGIFYSSLLKETNKSKKTDRVLARIGSLIEDSQFGSLNMIEGLDGSVHVAIMGALLKARAQNTNLSFQEIKEGVQKQYSRPDEWMNEPGQNCESSDLKNAWTRLAHS